MEARQPVTPRMGHLLRRPRMLGQVNELDAGKLDWVVSLPASQAAKDALARIIDADGERDDAENSYYEAAADPTFVQIEAARRSLSGSLH